MKHVVMFSGGVGSWAAAKRVAERHGTSDLTLLFADTMMEDADLYRFIEQAAADVGGVFVKIADGRTPWEVFSDEKFLGNSRVDPCSRILKRQLLDKWRDKNCEPESTVCYLGIDWSEKHRIERLQKRVLPWVYEAPLCDRPCLTKDGMFSLLEKAGIKRPRLYDLGFPHNNCGGFCIKAGKSHFRHLLETLPDLYEFHETKERELRVRIGKNVSILADLVKGRKVPLTLESFRKRIQKNEPFIDFGDEEWGGCGCAIE